MFFEGREDVRFFLAQLARAVRRGLIEVHAYVLLGTHFHLLVRSLKGELSAVMRQIQLTYVRWFNRRRRRDGPLVRGRFLSRRVTSLRYRMTLVRYIDRNPTAARIAAAGVLYAYGSAAAYARPKGPPWLERSWVESVVRYRTGSDRYDPAAYARVFGEGLSPAQVRLVAARMQHPSADSDDLDDLVHVAPERVQSWMRARAALADGTEPGVPVVDAQSVEEVLREREAADGPWPLLMRKKHRSGWDLARVALLRDLAAVKLTYVAQAMDRSRRGVQELHEEHRGRLEQDPTYAGRVADLAHRVLERCHGVRQEAALAPE
jgi:hypothetical protein